MITVVGLDWKTRDWGWFDIGRKWKQQRSRKTYRQQMTLAAIRAANCWMYSFIGQYYRDLELWCITCNSVIINFEPRFFTTKYHRSQVWWGSWDKRYWIFISLIARYACTTLNTLSSKMRYEYDSIIVGSGGTGCTTLQKLIVDSEVRGTTLQKLIVDSEVRGTTLQKLSSIARYEVRLYKS